MAGMKSSASYLIIFTHGGALYHVHGLSHFYRDLSTWES